MRYIICRGGLGNQMFQYAFALAMKQKTKRKVCFDVSLYDYVNMHNGFELNEIFCLQDSIKVIKFLKILTRLLLKINRWPIYRDINKYKSEVFDYKSLFFIGDWQSEKYFSEVSDIVKENFQFKHISNHNINIGNQIKCHNSISVHIRRGDYVGNSLHGGCASEDYYKNALTTILARVDDPVLWIFSDDIEWCRNSFLKHLGVSMKFVDWNNDKDSYQDMFLMSQCKHNIIANSSFSWWGAWLNNNPDKIVIAPQKWFNSNPEHYADIIPETWIKI